MSRRWMGARLLLLRTLRARRRQDAGAALRAVARGAGTAVGLRIRGRRIVLLLDPGLAGQLLCGHAAETVKGPGTQRTKGLLGEGLLTSEGAAHDRARRLVAPAFSPRRLEAYTGTFARRARDHAVCWADAQQVNMHAEMTALTLQIVGQTLLGVDLSAAAPQVRAGLESALAAFAGNQVMLPGLPRPGGVVRTRRGREPGGDGAGTGTAQTAVHQLVDDICEQRRTSPSGDRGDVISALLAASAGDGGLTADEVHDHVVTLLMAGHETTANALSWALYLLGRHPGTQDKLQAEADTLGDRLPGFADLPALAYTRAVISEAIRLYPPAWLIGRTTTTDLDLGGWHLPAGSVAAVSPLLLHHDPRWFPDPEAFDPGRWLDQRRGAVPRHAYLPFGSGPRGCIGEQFAWAEAITVLAVLARSWTVRTAPGFEPAVQYRVTLRPAGGLPMTVHLRC